MKIALENTLFLNISVSTKVHVSNKAFSKHLLHKASIVKDKMFAHSYYSNKTSLFPAYTEARAWQRPGLLDL